MAKEVLPDKDKILGKKVIAAYGTGKKRTLRDRLKSGLQSLIGGSKVRKSKKAVAFSKSQTKKRVAAEVKRHMESGGKDYKAMTLRSGIERAGKEMKKDKR